MVREVDSILVAAHELKAPVSLLRQLALSLELTDTTAEQRRICAQMVNVSERALLQVNDLAKVARLEDGLFDMEPVSVRGVCELVSRDINPLFGYDRKALQVKYHNRNHKLAIANAELLYSVIYNFCVNAIHYSESNTTSVLTVSDESSKIKVTVRDFGPALPKKIWTQLRRGGLDQPSAITMRPGSSGLGLYISSRFAEYMNAQLGAVRHRDGTSFFVELPISRQGCLF